MDSCCRKIYLSFVWTVIVVEFVLYIMLFVRGLYTEDKVAFWIIFILFIYTATLSIVSYWLTIVTDPGSPEEDLNMHFDNIQEIKRKAQINEALKTKRHKKNHNHNHNHQDNTCNDYNEIQALTQLSYCFKCNRIKELRVHHCKLCERCIMRMDHHCPFVGNCVGKFNHKYFILFLFYSTVACLIIIASICIDYFTEIPVWKYYNIWGIILIVLTLFIAIGLGIPIGTLLVSQIWILGKNMTTLESFIDGIQNQNPFDKKNFVENLQQIFGNSSWCWPTRPFQYQKPANCSNEF